MLRFLSSMLTCVLLTLALVSSACAQTISGIVYFGDSLSDPGNNFIFTGESTRQPFPIGPAGFSYDIGGHHYSNGATWAEQLATTLHMPTSGKPALRQPGLFTNYAVGSARSRAGAPTFPYFDLTTQVARFLGDFHGQAPANTLFVIWIGATDLDDALNAFASDPTSPESVEIVEQALASIVSNIETLYGAGAREFLIVDVPDLSKTPYVRYLGAHVNPFLPFIAQKFTYGFDAELRAVTQGTFAGFPGMQYFEYFDVNTLFNQVIAAPGSFGFSNVQDRCTVPNVIGNAICANPDSYLFWDATHPTTAGHTAIAAAALSLLPKQ